MPRVGRSAARRSIVDASIHVAGRELIGALTRQACVASVGVAGRRARGGARGGARAIACAPAQLGERDVRRRSARRGLGWGREPNSKGCGARRASDAAVTLVRVGIAGQPRAAGGVSCAALPRGATHVRAAAHLARLRPEHVSGTRRATIGVRGARLSVLRTAQGLPAGEPRRAVRVFTARAAQLTAIEALAPRLREPGVAMGPHGAVLVHGARVGEHARSGIARAGACRPAVASLARAAACSNEKGHCRCNGRAPCASKECGVHGLAPHATRGRAAREA